jgi:RND family efflux transporter MFP subunit
MKKTTLILAFILIMMTVVACSNEEPTDVQEASYIAVEIETANRERLYFENNYTGRVYPGEDAFVMAPLVAEVERLYVTEGDVVDKDDVLFTLDRKSIQSQVDQAQAALRAAEANYNMTVEQIQAAKDAYERTKALYEEGVVSKAQYQQAELAASDKPLEAAARGVDQARLAVEQARDALSNVSVKAPMSGTIMNVDIKEGQIALNSQPAMMIMDLDQLHVRIDVAENRVNELAVGQSVDLVIDSAGVDISTHISHVGRTVDSMTGLYSVEAVVENNGKVRPGMFGRVTIYTDERENVISIPSNAVMQRGEDQIVFVAIDEMAEERVVVTGLDTGRRVEIVSGIEAGDRVIVRGQNYVSDGSLIKVVRGE